MSIQLPDSDVIPRVGSAERDVHEKAALARSYELIHECSGKLRVALDHLEQELRGPFRYETKNYQTLMVYGQEIVRYVEQVWASGILVARKRT